MTTPEQYRKDRLQAIDYEIAQLLGAVEALRQERQELLAASPQDLRRLAQEADESLEAQQVLGRYLSGSACVWRPVRAEEPGRRASP